MVLPVAYKMHACFLDSTCMLFVALKDKAPDFFMTEEDFEKLTEVANDEVRIFYSSFWTLNAPNLTPQKKIEKSPHGRDCTLRVAPYGNSGKLGSSLDFIEFSSC